MTAMPTFASFAAARLLFMAFLSLAAMADAGQAVERVAIFDLELVRGADNFADTARLAADEKRLAMASARLRGLFSKDARFDVVDVASVAAKAKAVHLQACGGCASDFAREAGARIAVTGEIRKTSELILAIFVTVHDANGQQLAAAAVDIRGNTDESWRRGVDYLFRNVLMPRLERALR